MAIEQITIEKLMVDAIDLHVHGAPEPILGQRRINAFQLAQLAKEARMKAIVIKSHEFGTATMAWMVNRLVDSPILVGSICLNSGAGGLNPDVVEAQAQAGARVVWMPTMRTMAKGIANGAGKGIWIIDKNGKLVPQIGMILEVMKKSKLVLATGHISNPEVFAVAAEALRQHVNIIITHPFGSAGIFTMEEVKELAKMGAYIEFTFAHCMPPMVISPADMVSHIKTIGPDHCVLATDFGQGFNPPATEGFRMMLAMMLKFGLSEDELRILVKVNPANLLGQSPVYL